MHRFVFLTILLIATSMLAAQSPIVAGARHAPTSPERGHTLIDELSCVRCHEGLPVANANATPRMAPDLSRVGERVRGDWMVRFIADPQGVKPGTTMPHATSKENAEAIAHWLVSRSKRRPQSVAPDLGAAARGERLFHQVGCVACHSPRGEGVEFDEPAVALPPRMEQKYAMEGLERFLRDPLSVRPSGRMPHLGLQGREPRDIAHYLLAATPATGPLQYAYHPERHETLDTFDPGATEPETTGIAEGFDPAVSGRRRHDFALVFTGFVKVPTAGRYTFEITSDDGTRLYLNGALVVDNDGHRRNQKSVTRSASIDLAAGPQPIELRYFQRVKNTVIDVQWSGPGLSKRPLGKDHLTTSPTPVEPLPTFEVDDEKARRGKDLFVSEGCASCHRADRAIQPPEPVAITAVSHQRGCLSESPEHPAPDFRLSATDRNAIRDALVDDAPPAEATNVARRLRAFDCYACHERDGIGGPTDARDEWFTSSGHNQGQEGRIPPRLTGVGDKLKRPWLDRVLNEGASVRPLFHTRMPRYGAGNLEGLADALVRLDRKPSPVPAVSDAVAAQREAGRRLIAPQGGFNCVACHLFNEREAPTMQMVDLVGITDRIHEDWFQRWIRDPGSYYPGTRMPEYLAHPDILDGDRDRQFAAIWTYLADGKKAVLPDGLSRQNLELVVGGEAIVYRGKIRDAGFRGVCVGHPEEAHYAFDAENCRPAMLWKGRFLNVAPHWRVQSMGRIGPRGHDVIKLPKLGWRTELGHPGDVPPSKTRFRGYRLGDKGRPTFLYDINGVPFRETGVMHELENGRRAYHRTLHYESNSDVPRGLGIPLAEGKNIEREGQTFRIDGKWSVTVGGDGRTTLSGNATKTLRLHIEAQGKRKVEVRYEW